MDFEVAGRIGEHGEERVGGHRQGGPPVPGARAADLVLVQADQAFAYWKFFSTSTSAGHQHELGR